MLFSNTPKTRFHIFKDSRGSKDTADQKMKDHKIYEHNAYNSRHHDEEIKDCYGRKRHIKMKQGAQDQNIAMLILKCMRQIARLIIYLNLHD